jgi:hypothetical protein
MIKLIIGIHISYVVQLILMTENSAPDHSRQPKNRGEVYKQEQQKIAEESGSSSSAEPRQPKNRGEVYKQEQQKIAEESE